MNGIRVVQLNATALVWASGVLDAGQAADLHRAFELVLIDEVSMIVLDLAAVRGLDGAAVAVLAAAAGRLGHRGGVVQLLLPQGHRAAVRDAATMRQVLARLYPPIGQAEAA